MGTILEIRYVRSEKRIRYGNVQLHQIGVPHRVGYMARILAILCQGSDVIFMTGSQIADWYTAEEQPS
jgi:hypothetical protein